MVMAAQSVAATLSVMDDFCVLHQHRLQQCTPALRMIKRAKVGNSKLESPHLKSGTLDALTTSFILRQTNADDRRIKIFILTLRGFMLIPLTRHSTRKGRNTPGHTRFLSRSEVDQKAQQLARVELWKDMFLFHVL